MELKFFGASILQQFDFSFERGVASSYIVVTPKGNEKYLTYQVEMIAINCPQGIIPFSARTNNGQVDFYCNVTSLLSISEFMKHRRLGKREFANILLGMTKIILDCGKYLLSDNGFLLDRSYIFINPANFDVSMIYIPIEQSGDTNTRYRDLMVDLIVNSVDLVDDTGDAFLHRILATMRSSEFSVMAVDNLLKELLDEANGIKAKATEVHEVSEKVEKKVGKEVDKKVGKEVDKEVGKEVEKNKLSVTSKSSVFNHRVWLIIFGQLACVGIAFGLIFFLRKNGLDKKEFAWSIMLIVAAIDTLLMKALIFQKKTTEATATAALAEKKSTRGIKDSSWIADEVNAKAQVGTKKSDLQIYTTKPEAKMYTTKLDTKMQTTKSDACTELLSAKSMKRAYLERQGNERAELVELAGEDFLIGRLAEAVDYACTNTAVGKVHARISKKDENYYVTDLNSRNGTFINDKRIDCNTEYGLVNKDRVSFANEEYVFVQV